MKLKLRVGTAAIALLVAMLGGAPAVAQQSAAPATNSAQPSADVVGPAQLKDFSLNGTVTRRAADAPAAPAATTTPSRASTRAAQTSPEQAAPSAAAPQRREVRASVAPPSQASQPKPQPQQQTTTATKRDPFDFAPPTPGNNSGAGFAPATVTPQPASSSFDTYSPTPDESGGLLKWLPWLAALIAAAGAALWYFRRERPGRGYALAGAGADVSAFDMGPTRAPPRAAPPPPRAPVPAPPPPAAPVGIVSTRLRPTLEIEFVPQRAVINDDGATIEFEIGVFNSGSAPARDVLVEAALFNAGPEQDESIGAFFARPTAQGEPIPALPPLQRLTFNHAVAMTREQMRLFNVEDRSVFVPVIGFNALFKWSGGDGQTSASYIVGRDGNGDKLAPFRTDLGARVFRDVGAREHSLTVRK
jgi:hypothetical protein